MMTQPKTMLDHVLGVTIAAVCVSAAACTPEYDLSIDGSIGNGGACTLGSECVSAHCQNGMCCPFGECCNDASDCPSQYTVSATCSDSAECQGRRGEASCSEEHSCLTAWIDDDSACDDRVECAAVSCSDERGLELGAATCTGESEQSGCSENGGFTACGNYACDGDVCGTSTCRNHWEGASCETCPGNWDPAQDCGECLAGWDGSNCDVACGTDTCTDTTTGMVWQREVANNVNWSDAKSICAELDLAGKTDWRLATISELRSLIRGCPDSMTGGGCAVTDSCLDDSCSASCGYCGYDDGPADYGCYWMDELHGRCDFYWSSSAVGDKPDYAWGVNFRSGAIRDGSTDYGSDRYGRCVRDGP